MTRSIENARKATCAPEAMAFGVGGARHERPLVRYLNKPVPIVAVLETGLSPDEVNRSLRVVSDCASHGCRHFDGHSARCTLAQAVQRTVEPAVDVPSPCAIRKDCVWWNQEGTAICRRCPVVTREPLCSA
jgi:hypothetical protein